VVDGEGEVVAVHSPYVTLEGVVAGKAGGGVAARAGVGQGAGVGPAEPQQGHIIKPNYFFPNVRYSVPQGMISHTLPKIQEMGKRIKRHHF
jgi:hypothetical protein